jgi:hypothetical protein
MLYCRPSLVLIGVLSTASCSGSDQPLWPDGYVLADTSLYLDGVVADIGLQPDGLVFNSQGPTIDVLTPTAGAITVDSVLLVQAKISDPDGVSPQTIAASLQGGSPVTMAISDTVQVYEAKLDVSSRSGKQRLIVVATDLLGNQNTTIVEFERDAGPLIQFLSPTADSRHKNSVSVKVAVADDVPITAFQVRLGSHVLALTKADVGNGQFTYTGLIEFDDPKFGTPLSGKQVLVATAENSNKAQSTLDQVFYVDDEGPSISRRET